MMACVSEPRTTSPTTGGEAAPRNDIAPLLAGYWSFGQFWGVWVILVFEFQDAHRITDARIGVYYTLLSLIAVGVMLLVAPRLQPFALSTTVPLSLGIMSVATFAVGYLPTDAILVTFALLGVGNGLVDVYMNVAAQRSEARTNKPVLQWMHATYALGGITGASVAGALRAADIDFRVGFAYAGIALAVTSVWTSSAVPRERHVEGTQTLFSISALFRTPKLLVPALIVLSAFLIEGSMDVWSGLYLRNELGASASTAAMAFVAFASAVLFGRLFASRVLYGMGRRTTILVAGFGSLIGGTIAVAADQVFVVALGYLVLGFTLSAAVPAAFGLVGDSGEDPTNAIAAVTTVGYTGFIWSPPLLGWIAQSFSLRAAMSVIVVATFGIIAGGMLAPRDARA
jgi:predicted MFS family arabinose efflux permease